MIYQRKTKDIYVIQVYNSYDNSWEDVTEYSKPDYENPRLSCKQDLKEYRFSNQGIYRMIIKRERI